MGEPAAIEALISYRTALRKARLNGCDALIFNVINQRRIKLALLLSIEPHTIITVHPHQHNDH